MSRRPSTNGLDGCLTAATRRHLLDALLAEALAPVDAHELEAAE